MGDVCNGAPCAVLAFAGRETAAEVFRDSAGGCLVEDARLFDAEADLCFLGFGATLEDPSGECVLAALPSCCWLG